MQCVASSVCSVRPLAAAAQRRAAGRSARGLAGARPLQPAGERRLNAAAADSETIASARTLLGLARPHKRDHTPDHATAVRIAPLPPLPALAPAARACSSPCSPPLPAVRRSVVAAASSQPKDFDELLMAVADKFEKVDNKPVVVG